MSDGDVFLIDYSKLASPWLFYPLSVATLFVCFFTLYLLADRHLNRSLELLAVRLKMSPAIAGLTLLAFGNGASDFFTAVLGVDDAPAMILGSSVGSGLFLTLVVLGFTLIFAKHPDSLDGAKGEPEIVLARGPFLKTVSVYTLCCLFVVYLGYTGRVHRWQPVLLLGGFFLYIGWAVYGHYGKHGKADAADAPEDAADDLALASLLDSFESEDARRRLAKAVSRWWALSGFRGLDGLLAAMSTPISLVLNCSIPPMTEQAADGPQQRVLFRVFSLYRRACCPLGITTLVLAICSYSYPGTVSLRNGLLCYLIAVTLSIVLFRTNTTWRQRQQSLIPTVLAFAVCIVWVYSITKELLCALTAVARRTGIDDAVLGITILAWGNSCGDLISDVTLARNGHAESAAIAALSGPIQNVLLTLGVCFLMAVWRPGTISLFDGEHDGMGVAFYVTGLWLLVNLVGLLVIVPVFYKFRLPRTYGFALLASYAAYLVVIVGLVYFRYI